MVRMFRHFVCKCIKDRIGLRRIVLNRLFYHINISKPSKMPIILGAVWYFGLFRYACSWSNISLIWWWQISLNSRIHSHLPRSNKKTHILLRTYVEVATGLIKCKKLRSICVCVCAVKKQIKASKPFQISKRTIEWKHAELMYMLSARRSVARFV